MADFLNHIIANPHICFGKPTIRGTRIWVSLILDMLAGGMTVDEIIEEYPYLEADDVRATIAYKKRRLC